MTDCYHCKTNPALEGVFFPFCGEECKEKWNESKPKPKSVGSKKTIEEIQEIIMTKWKPLAAERRKLELVTTVQKDIFDVASEIFG